MANIGFYHLTRSGLDRALPQLLGRTLAAGQRAVIRCSSAERVEALDTALWLCQDPDWLPHGTRSSNAAALQPIWLTTEDEAPNGARYLFLIDGTDCAGLEAYERIFDLFDGHDEASVAAARTRWAARKAAGHKLVYWQQGPKGWEQKS